MSDMEVDEDGHGTDEDGHGTDKDDEQMRIIEEYLSMFFNKLFDDDVIPMEIIYEPEFRIRHADLCFSCWVQKSENLVAQLTLA